MKITIVGTGYVGLVTGVCLADTGNHVVGLDVDADKVARLSRGECTIFEPGLTDLLKTNLDAGRFRLTTSLKEAVDHADIIFIAIGTPPKPNGAADLSMIEKAAVQIAQAVSQPTILVMKSTVPVGTGSHIEKLIAPHARHKITVVSNPEFLKEGSAVDDFLRPDRVVIGTDDREAAEIMRTLYAPFVRNQRPILVVARAAAEMIKYAANCYLATRITFINLVANVCQKHGVDVNEVREGIGHDARIGHHFMYPGIGYGGSCFPKDVQAFCDTAREAGVDPKLLDAVHESNERQKAFPISWAREALGDNLRGKTFAIWGIAFKPKTDDIREAPSMSIIRGLLAAGATVRASDPKAIEHARKELSGGVTFHPDGYEALAGADALIICTEWNEYRSPDFNRIKESLRQPVILDGRNLYDPQDMRRRGFIYFSIGRPAVRP